MTQLVEKTNIDYMDEPQRTNGRRLLNRMIHLQATGKFGTQDALWVAATKSLGGDIGRYEGFYICLQCGAFYHGDYSTNSDPDRDFCGTECEVDWLESNPEAEYHGELKEE